MVLVDKREEDNVEPQNIKSIPVPHQTPIL
jgi:hypothetical protein